MQKRWYNLTTEQIAEQLNTDTDAGLSAKEARKRLSVYKENDAFIMPENSFSSYVKAVSKDVTGYMMIASAVMAVIFSEEVSALVIIALILLNFVSALLFYGNSAKTLHNMAKYASPMSRVVRDSQLTLINQRKIVPGDIIVLGAGDIVPCDCRIISCDNFFCLEKNLTGVSSEVQKDPKLIYGLNVRVENQKNTAFATSLVTKGTATAIACETGSNTYANEINARPEIITHDNLDIIRAMKKYSTSWGLTMLFMILVLTGLDLILGLKTRSLFDIFISGLSLAVAAITEMYAVFGYFVIAHGLNSSIRKYGKVISGAAIKNVELLPKIKDITTLIVPKKGGFFAKTTALEMLWCQDTLHRADERNLLRYCDRLLKLAMLSSGYNGANRDVLKNPANDACAIVSASEKLGLDRNTVGTENPCLDYTQIELAEQQCDLSLVAYDDDIYALAKGDAKRLLYKCSTYFDDYQEKPLTEKEKKRISDTIDNITEKGYRALGIISRKSDIFLAGGVDSELCDWNFEGFVIMLDVMLRGAKETVELCRKNNIKVMMLCNETGEQNRVYAKRLGLISEEGGVSDGVLTSKDMSSMSDYEFSEKLSGYALLEGLTFLQKKLLISHLQKKGEVVGYLATELDETILLKKADVGFTGALALSDGASSIDLCMNDSPVYIHNKTDNPAGCEALKFICDVLVSPPERKFGGFNGMVSAVMASKNIYRNIKKTIKYLIASQLTRFLIVFYSVIAGYFGINGTLRMLTSPQVLFSGLICDFAVVVAIAFQRRNNISSACDISVTEPSKSVLNKLSPILLSVIWTVLIVISPIIISAFSIKMTSEEITSTVFVLYILSQIIVAWEIINDGSAFRLKKGINKAMAVISLFVVLFTAALNIPFFGALFDYVTLNPAEWICIAAILTLLFALIELFKQIRRAVTVRLSK